MCQNERDRRLKELAIAAQSHPPGSLKRQQILDRLFRLLLQAIERIPLPIDTEFDRYLYDEAKQVTLQEMCRRIDEYNPQRGDILGWYKKLLKYRLIDVQRRHYRQGLTDIPQNQGIPSLTDLDDFFSSDQFRSDELPPLQQLRQLIEEDPDRMFSSVHVTGRPDANFQFLAIAHIWEGRKWKEIAQILGNISVPTISGFYQTTLRHFGPFFRNHLEQ